MGAAAEKLDGYQKSERSEANRLKSLELLSALKPVQGRKPMPVATEPGEHFIHIPECPYYDTCLHQAGIQDWNQVSCHRCGIYTQAHGEMISWLKSGKLPKGVVEEDPGLQADVDCLQQELAAARTRIKELETEMPKKKTDAKMIKAWLLANKQQLSYQDIGEKLEISAATASAWCTEVNESPTLLRDAKARFDGKPAAKEPASEPQTVSAKPSKKKKKEDTQQAEINYLRWCLEGERNGFVDRMLEELGKAR